ncbi:hypothetical protein SLS58_008490 [Diplodia intermedia]|uniref:Uncharacterized protein n=1 Tax=Diplodia intermedia TaxID=856260 RepID=A0ABR3THA2_9PEZI
MAPHENFTLQQHLVMMLALTSLLFPFLPAMLPALFSAALSDADTQTDEHTDDPEDDSEFADAVEYQPQSTGMQVSDEIRKFWEERSIHPFPFLTKHYRFKNSNGDDANDDDVVSFSSSTSSMNVELGSASDASSTASSPSTKNNRVSAPSTDNAATAAAAADRRASVSSFDSTGSTIVTADSATELPADIDAGSLIGAAPIPAMWMEHDGVIYRNGHARGVATAVHERKVRDLRDLNETIAADMAGVVGVFEAQEHASVASLAAEHAADLARADAFVAAVREQNRGALDDQRKKHDAAVAGLRAEHKGTVSILLTRHRAELAVVRTQCQNDVASVRAQCEADVAAVETRCQKEVTEVKAQLESDAAVVKTQCQQQVASIEAQHQKEVSSIKADHVSDVESIHSQHVSEIASLKADHASDVASIHSQHVSEITSIKSDHQSEIDSIKSEHQSEIDSIKFKHISEKDSDELQREAEIVSIQLQHESQVAFIQSHHDSEIASSQSRHESEIASSKSRYESEIASILNNHESALDNLDAEVTAAIDSLDEAYSSLKADGEPSVILPKTVIQQQAHIALIKSTYESHIRSLRAGYLTALNDLRVELTTAIASLEKKFRSTISSRCAGRNQPTRANSEAETHQSLQNKITTTLADARALILTSFDAAQRYSGPAASHPQNDSESSSCDSEATTLENSLIRIESSLRQEFFASRPANRAAHQQEQSLAIVGPPSDAANALKEDDDTDSVSDACTVIHRPDCADDQLTNNLAATSDDFAERLAEWLKGQPSRDMIPKNDAVLDDRDHPRSPQRGFVIGEVEESDVHVADHQYPETLPAAVGLGITFEEDFDNHGENSYGSPKWYEEDMQADQKAWRPTSSMNNAAFPPEDEEEKSCIDVEEEHNFIQAPMPIRATAVQGFDQRLQESDHLQQKQDKSHAHIYTSIPVRPVNAKVSKHDQSMQEKSQQQKARDRQQQEQDKSYAHIHAPKPIRATVFHGRVEKLEAMVEQQEADELLHEQEHNMFYSPTAIRIVDIHPQQQEEEGSDFSDGLSSDGSVYGPTATKMIDVQARSQGLRKMMQQQEQLISKQQKGDATPPVEETASKTALQSPFEYYNESCSSTSTPSLHAVTDEPSDTFAQATKDKKTLQAANELLRLDCEALSVDNETLQFQVESLQADNQTLSADNQSLHAHIAVLEATNAHNSAAFAEAAAAAQHNEQCWKEAAAAAAAERTPAADEETASLLRQQEELTQDLSDELEAGAREREAQAAALAAADDKIAALETQLRDAVLARMHDDGLKWSNRKQAAHVRALLAAQVPAENARIRLHNANVALRKQMAGVERNAGEARAYADAVLDGTFRAVEEMRTAGVANVERLAELTDDEVVGGLARYLRDFMDAANGNVGAARKLLVTNAELVEEAAEGRERIAALEDEVVAAKDACTDANDKLDDAIIAEEIAVAVATRAEAEVAELREKAELVPVLEETVKELEDALLDARVEAAPEAYKEIMEDLRTELHARQTGIDALTTRVRAAEEVLTTHSKCEKYFTALQDQTEAHRGLITVLYKRNHELAVELVRIRKAAGLPAKNYIVDGGCGQDAYGKLKMRVILQKMGEVHKYELIEEDFEFCADLDELMMQPADEAQHLALDRPYTAVENLIDRLFGTALDFCGIALGTGKTPDDIELRANYLKLRATVPGEEPDDEPLDSATDPEVQGNAIVVYAGHQAQQNDEAEDARDAELQAKEDERIWEEETF